MTTSYGPYHSLSESDRVRLIALVTRGRSVRSSAYEIGCNYGHALNFCHAHKLIEPRKRQRPLNHNTPVIKEFLTRVRHGQSVHAAAVQCGINDTAAYAIAMDAGCHIRLSRYQRRVRQTQLRVEYLRLRLASVLLVMLGVHSVLRDR